MSLRDAALNEIGRGWVGVALTWISGYIDAVGYLTFNHIYTANMSGNTIAVGLGIARGQRYEIVQRGWPILTFFCGMVLSSVLLEFCARRNIRSRYSVTMALEFALLTSLAAWGRGRLPDPANIPPSLFFGGIAMGALAMGIQNATLTSAGALTIRTTHVTGMLAELSQVLSARMLGRTDFQFRASAAILASIWIAFAIGATAGAVALQQWGLTCLFLPCAIIAFLIAVDLRHPIAPTHRHLPAL